MLLVPNLHQRENPGLFLFTKLLLLCVIKYCYGQYDRTRKLPIMYHVEMILCSLIDIW